MPLTPSKFDGDTSLRLKLLSQRLKDETLSFYSGTLTLDDYIVELEKEIGVFGSLLSELKTAQARVNQTELPI